MVKKILAYILSLIYYLNFGLILIVFHILQVIAYNVFGYYAHKRMVDFMNWFLVMNLYSLFCRPLFYGLENIPKGKPLIVVGNHQSMYDISPAYVAFKNQHIKFISKKSLGKGIPGISYNLQKGGSVLIDRKDNKQSISEIAKLGRYIEKNKYSACIYPEGTRSKDGKLKAFKSGGFKILLMESPSAVIVPFVVDGNYKLHKWGSFPLNIGLRLKYTVLPPVSRENKSAEDLLKEVHDRIKDKLAGV